MWLSEDERLERRNERKKEYNRDRFRQKRSLYVSETQALGEQIEALTSQLKALKSISALPWKDVAEALEDDKKLIEFQNKDLKKKVKLNREMCLALMAWARKCSVISVMPTSNQSTWQINTLPPDGPARKLGLEWISKRLYHTLEQEIQRSCVPVTDDPYFSVTVEPFGDSYRLLEYKQRIEAHSFEHVAKCLDKIYLSVMEGDEVEVNDPTMLYLIYESHFGQTLGIKTKEKMLVSRFQEEDRYIIFTHGVVGDEKYSERVRCNFWSAWVVIKRLTPTMTLIKHGYECHGLRYEDRFLTIDEEIPHLSVYDDDDMKFSILSERLKDYRRQRYVQDLADFARYSKEILDARGSL